MQALYEALHRLRRAALFQNLQHPVENQANDFGTFAKRHTHSEWL